MIDLDPARMSFWNPALRQLKQSECVGKCVIRMISSIIYQSQEPGTIDLSSWMSSAHIQLSAITWPVFRARWCRHFWLYPPEHPSAASLTGIQDKSYTVFRSESFNNFWGPRIGIAHWNPVFSKGKVIHTTGVWSGIRLINVSQRSQKAEWCIAANS